MRGKTWIRRAQSGLLATGLAVALCLSACGDVGMTMSDDSSACGDAGVTMSDDSSAYGDVGMLVQSRDLMAGIQPQTVAAREADDPFLNGVADFSVTLFQSSRTADENFLLSPLSALIALSMTANGAGGETLQEMEQVLCGGVPIAQLNEYLHTYTAGLPSGDDARLQLANSLWFREGEVQLAQPFLQANADYYGAPAHMGAFDSGTVQEINEWAKRETDGMIDTLLEEIPREAMLYLLNAVMFDAQWERPFEEANIREQPFYAANGESQTAQMMHATERLLRDGETGGFIKSYAGGRYAFVGLLPPEGELEAYIASLTGERLRELVLSASYDRVYIALPKFCHSCEIELNGALEDMGMVRAFAPETADFTRIGDCLAGRLYISRVFQKTYIDVNEQGTRAAAVTGVEVAAESMPPLLEFNRPFVYAVVDLETGLPLFLGTVTHMEA